MVANDHPGGASGYQLRDYRCDGQWPHADLNGIGPFTP
jgi:hypothetical protein